MKKVIYIVILIIIVGLIVSFTKDEKSDARVAVGVLAPLTGFAAEHGEGVKNGIELAKEVLGDENISLIYEDTACDPKKAINGFNKLVDQDGVKIIIGVVCSGDALAISDLAREKDVTVIASLAASPDLTDAGDHFFRTYPSDIINADLISNYITENDFKNVSVISVNNDYGEGLVQRLNEVSGDRITSHEKFGVTETDFRVNISKAKVDSDLIVFVGYTNNTIVFLKQQAELGLEQDIVGSVASFTTDLFTIDSSLTNNFIISSPEISPEGRGKFVKEYNTKFGIDPKFPSEYGFDAFLSLKSALKDSGYNIEGFRDVLNDMKIEGVSGDLSFDEKGNREGLDLRMYKINNEKEMVCYFNCK